MAVAQGYGKTVTSGSVFAYDVADIVNSYRGKPTTNLLTTIGYDQGTQNGTYFKTNYGTEQVTIPKIPKTVTAHYCNIYNDYNGGSGNCCPSIFNYGNLYTVSPSTTYTYQIIFRTSTGYYSANYMYRYEYNTNTYITEGGYVDASRMEDLGDGWKHAWGTFTTNASTNRVIPYSFHYEYGVWTKVQVAGIMLTQGSSIIPPTQFVNVNTTRSATQGLLPLVGNSTIDLTNVSFDSSAQIAFDGTNDYIQSSFSNFNTPSGSIECLVFPETGGGSDQMVLNIGSTYTLGASRILRILDGYWAFATYGSSTQDWDAIAPVSYNVWNHVVISWQGTTLSLHVNTAPYSVVRSGVVTPAGTLLRVGAGVCNLERYFKGKLAVTKVYNRALSAAEIKQNYLHYKTRFNLS
jgi:hypothetical protein